MNPYAPPQAPPSTAPEPAGSGDISAAGIATLSAIAANVAARWAMLLLYVVNTDSIAAGTVSPTLITVDRVIGGIEGLTRIGSIVLFLVWVYRSASRARALGRQGLSISPAMCVGWFFVPLANFVMSYVAMSQIALAADREGRGSTPAFVPAWWGLYVASGVTSILRQLMGSSMADLGVRLGMWAVADVAAAGSLVALFLVVRFVDGGLRYWASVKLA